MFVEHRDLAYCCVWVLITNIFPVISCFPSAPRSVTEEGENNYGNMNKKWNNGNNKVAELCSMNLCRKRRRKRERRKREEENLCAVDHCTKIAAHWCLLRTDFIFCCFIFFMTVLMCCVYICVCGVLHALKCASIFFSIKLILLIVFLPRCFSCFCQRQPVPLLLLLYWMLLDAGRIYFYSDRMICVIVCEVMLLVYSTKKKNNSAVSSDRCEKKTRKKGKG